MTSITVNLEQIAPRVITLAIGMTRILITIGRLFRWMGRMAERTASNAIAAASLLVFQRIASVAMPIRVFTPARLGQSALRAIPQLNGAPLCLISLTLSLALMKEEVGLITAAQPAGNVTRPAFFSPIAILVIRAVLKAVRVEKAATTNTKNKTADSAFSRRSSVNGQGLLLLPVFRNEFPRL
jgi:hypothetical protein